MKRLNIFYLLALQLLAFELSEASLLARGRPKTKKLEEHTTEAPYVCLDSSANLPACNFHAEEVDEETVEKKTSRQLRSLDSLTEPEEISTFEENGSHHRGTTIIYKIEGCLPSRLPFVLPLCKAEDSIGRIVEVRRLFPFKVSSPTAQNSDALPTLVFPEVDLNQWHRFMEGPWIRPSANDDNVDQNPKETVPEEPQQDSDPKKTTKHKKAADENFATKKSVPQKFAEELSSGDLDENDIFSKFPSPSAMEKHLANDHQRDPDSYKTRSSRLNRIVADVSQDSNGEIVSQVAEKKKKPFPSLQHRHEFPYAEAIPYDPEKLRIARLRSELPYARAIPYAEEDLEVASEFPYNRAISYDPEKLRVARLESEFPYSQAIPYNPENLRVVSVGSEFPYSRAIPFDPTKLNLPKRGSEFPYSRAIHYDPENLRVASAGSEFPYSRAIPFDAAKLQVAKRGSEFPYTRAIPYDPKKLQERKTAMLAALTSFSRSLKAEEEHLTDSDKSEVVPFDTRMLDAAKDGGIFPYGKGVPDDTSKNVDTLEIPRTNGENVPVRHVKTFWDEFPTDSKQFSVRKEQTRLANFRAGRELEDNVIDTSNNEEEAHRGRIVSLKRVTRKAMESDGSGDSSSVNDNLEIPSRWSEFPYSKAIPFDPEKLRRPRSSMEYLESAGNIPQDFPYAKAIPYDPWKLSAFRRKKSGAQDEGTGQE